MLNWTEHDSTYYTVVHGNVLFTFAFRGYDRQGYLLWELNGAQWSRTLRIHNTCSHLIRANRAGTRYCALVHHCLTSVHAECVSLANLRSNAGYRFRANFD